MASTDHQLEDLRREVDRLDAAMVELLAERMAVVAGIARIKRAGGSAGPAIRPGREAVILRRLVERAAGRFPSLALARMWRELLAATTRAQAPLAIVVHAPADRPCLWDLARDHFGSATPASRVETSAEALRLAAESPGRLAVLPGPGPGRDWWTDLAEGAWPALRVVARLPFVRVEAEPVDAMVVAAMEPEASGDDLGLVAVPADRGLEPQRLVANLAGLDARWLATAAGATGEPFHLLELAGLPSANETRVATAVGPLRGTWLGGYARPLVVAA